MLYLDIHENFRDLSIYYQKLERFLAQPFPTTKVGFWGQPDQITMDLVIKYGFFPVDLDVPIGNIDVELATKTCCHIIQTIINNAVAMKDEIVFYLATTGPDKCDQGRNVRDLLVRRGHTVIDSSNLATKPIRPCLISTSRGPLKERVARIMRLSFDPLTREEEDFYHNNQSIPKAGFHGVPPSDLSLLDFFPEDTHIYGWTRLVEQGIPGRVDQEWIFDQHLPTVFYTQTFCNKELMASNLAKHAHALHIDAHETASGSAEAKLQAFLILSDRGERNAVL